MYHQYLSIFVGYFALMGAQLDRLRYEVFQNLLYSPMNTGFLSPAVATALTVYGIETVILTHPHLRLLKVATALTVYGIETIVKTCDKHNFFSVATALTVYGIETLLQKLLLL